MEMYHDPLAPPGSLRTDHVWKGILTVRLMEPGPVLPLETYPGNT